MLICIKMEGLGEISLFLISEDTFSISHSDVHNGFPDMGGFHSAELHSLAFYFSVMTLSTILAQFCIPFSEIFFLFYFHFICDFMLKINLLQTINGRVLFKSILFNLPNVVFYFLRYFFLYVWVLFLHLCLYTRRSVEGIASLGQELQIVVSSMLGKLKLCSVDEQPVLLTVDTLVSLSHCFIIRV